MAKLETKSIFQSKTFWFNVVMLVLDIVAVFQQSPVFVDKPAVLTVLGTIHTVGNIILRYLTDTAVTLR